MNYCEGTGKHDANLPERPEKPANVAQEVEHAVGLPADDSHVLPLDDVQAADFVQAIRFCVGWPVAVGARKQVAEVGVEEVCVGGLAPLEVCGRVGELALHHLSQVEVRLFWVDFLSGDGRVVQDALLAVFILLKLLLVIVDHHVYRAEIFKKFILFVDAVVSDLVRVAWRQDAFLHSARNNHYV